jgi:hypothetical protein
MIRLLASIIALWAIGNPAIAQTSLIRSGEHDGFTRLVLPLPKDANWSINQSEGSFSLKVDVPSIEFDSSRVFDRIGRSRLVAISQDGPGSELVFSLACACLVSSFVDTPGFLVIDISDEVSTPNVQPQTFGLPIRQAEYRFSSQPKPTARPAPGGLMLPKEIGQVLEPPPPAGMPPPSIGRSIRPPVAINLSEKRLLAQISRAADQGLLELTPKPNATGKVADADVTEGRQVERQKQAQGLPLSALLSVTTAIDRDLALVADTLGQSASGPNCLEQDRVALSDWGDDQPFSTEIGRWRSRLFGEFDNLNPDAAEGLARAYLYYGFGAEAAQAIGLGAPPNAESRVLKALAEILDTGSPPDDNPFAGQQSCEADVALWSVLSSEITADDANTKAILRGFSRLPPHLRSYLGPKVSQKFSKAGDSKTAGAILRAITWSGEETGSEINLAKAAVAELRGDTQTVEKELTKSVVGGSEFSPKALVKLVAGWFDSREVLSPDLPDLTAAYASEYRNAEIGTDLRRAHVVALALAVQFDDAFSYLPELAKRDGDINRKKALEPLLELLSERAEDVVFLRYVLSTSLEGPPDYSDQVADRIARRLLDLGFPEKAAYWIEAPDGNANSKERRLMRAEIALARQLPFRALVELAGLTGRQATSLRAAAALDNGDYGQAGQILTTVGDFDGAARGFWLAEEWEAAPEQTNTRYGQVVSGSLRLRQTDATAPLTPLAQARALMQSSVGTREEVAALLQNVSGESLPQQ